MLLELASVEVVYDGAFLVLRGLSLAVAAGEVVALPTYPFQRRRYWVGSEPVVTSLA